MLLESVTTLGVAVNWSVAQAVRMAVLDRQGFDGTQPPLNETTWLVSKLIGPSTRTPLLLTKFVTVRPTSILLPQLVTVPVKVIAPFCPTPPTHWAVIWTQGVWPGVDWGCVLLAGWSVTP